MLSISQWRMDICRWNAVHMPRVQQEFHIPAVVSQTSAVSQWWQAAHLPRLWTGLQGTIHAAQSPTNPHWREALLLWDLWYITLIKYIAVLWLNIWYGWECLSLLSYITFDNSLFLCDVKLTSFAIVGYCNQFYSCVIFFNCRFSNS